MRRHGGNDDRQGARYKKDLLEHNCMTAATTTTTTTTATTTKPPTMKPTRFHLSKGRAQRAKTRCVEPLYVVSCACCRSCGIISGIYCARILYISHVYVQYVGIIMYVCTEYV